MYSQPPWSAIHQPVMTLVQAPLQRCAQRCQDKAQGQLPLNPKEKDVRAAQARSRLCLMSADVLTCIGQFHASKLLEPVTVLSPCMLLQAYMEKCAESCAEEFQQQIPKLYQQCLQSLDRYM